MAAKANAYDVLKERGFVQQVTDEEGLRELFAHTVVTAYIGFDPTADSLHVGSLMPIMGLVHLQRCGHRPIVVIGGGTALVGDPSGKTEMRQMLSREQIAANAERIRAQIARFVDLAGDRGIVVDNSEWLVPLNYIDFLREIGRHFSVNRMLAAEAYRIRLETGLSFLEFNYQLLQAYDYLVLYRRYGCRLQMGGDDQWGNIVAGIDLIRRLEGVETYGLTFPLLTTASGQKMGKTAKGAVWLDPQKTSPYDFYQYWINTDDRDVERFLSYFTLLPMEEVKRLGALQGEELREAKEVLAFEVTRLTHGEEEARRAREAARAAFYGAGDISALPTTAIPGEVLRVGLPMVDLLLRAGLVKSKSEARRLIQQGGAYINGERVDDVERIVSERDLIDGSLILRAGKKRYHRIVTER
ncbi:MAG: tyrosine--tRNA ligase [candidate division KSB1 bacterium]|nr:tyrosine--tRNA ligase [candidate division KSB1 bacterium]